MLSLFPTRFGLLNSPFSNKYVELNEEFMEFLRNHPWVRNKDSLEIRDVPDNFLNFGATQYVEVVIQADLETTHEIEDTCKGYSHRGVNLEGIKGEGMLCGLNLVYNRKASKDYFGILPYLLDKPIPARI